MLLFAVLFAVGVGSHAGAFLKALNEIALAGKAASVGNIRDEGIGIREQQILGTRNAQVVVKLLQSLVGDPVKIGVDLGDADVKFRGDLSRCQGLVKVLDQILHHVKDVVVGGVEANGGGEG